MSAIDIATTLIRRWEGCSLTAYPDPATGAEPWTIGYGATGPGITQGTVWTMDQAKADLQSRLGVLADAVQRNVPGDATDHQIGACLSFAYNEGLHAFLGSTLLRLWNAGNADGAANQFPLWDKAAGKEMQGLFNRRVDERRVFLGDDP